MPKYVHRFTGEVAEQFGFLPADPPSQWLEPGQTVTCFEVVEHPRLELVRQSGKSTKVGDGDLKPSGVVVETAQSGVAPPA